MARKPHSPFRGATEQQLAALRACITATQHWERALGTPEQYLERKLPMIVFDNLGYSARARIEQAALRRWQAAPHYSRSRAVHDDQHMQRYNRKAWEVKQLRLAVTAAEQTVRDLTGRVEGLEDIVRSARA